MVYQLIERLQGADSPKPHLLTKPKGATAPSWVRKLQSSGLPLIMTQETLELGSHPRLPSLTTLAVIRTSKMNAPRPAFSHRGAKTGYRSLGWWCQGKAPASLVLTFCSCFGYCLLDKNGIFFPVLFLFNIISWKSFKIAWYNTNSFSLVTAYYLQCGYIIIHLPSFYWSFYWLLYL